MTTVPLERLRRYRGTNSAVSRISDSSILSDLLNASSQHTREDITQAIMTCYAGAAYAEANWAKFIGAWGETPARTTLHGIFAQQYSHLAQLNLDHGIVTHLPEIMDFLKTHDSQDYTQVRCAFRQSMGTQTVWRGMVLTEAEMTNVRVTGIESDFLRKTTGMPSVIDNFEANLLSVYFSELMDLHFHGENCQSPLVSVSAHKDVAVAVGRHFGRRASSDAKKSLYLFKICIPEADLVYYTDHAVKTPEKLADLIRNGTKLEISVNGTMSSYPWDRHTESCVMYKINPGEIVEITKPSVSTSAWSGHVL